MSWLDGQLVGGTHIIGGKKLHFLSNVHFLSMKRFNLGRKRVYTRERCSALLGRLASGTDGSGVKLQLILLLRLALTFFTAKYAILNWLINYLTFLFVTIVWRELAITSSSPQNYSYFLKATHVRNFLSSAYLLDSLFLSVKHANTNTMTELVRRLHELACLASSRLTFPSCPWKHEM